MKTVAVITPGSLPVPPVLGGGIETVVYDYARLNKKQKCIIVSALDGGLPAAETDQYGIRHIRISNKSWQNVEVVWHHEYLIRYSRYIYEACRQLNLLNPDIVHIHNMPHWVPIVRRQMGLQVKIILTNHNEKIGNEKYARDRLSRIMASVDYLVYPSRRIAETDLIEKYPQYADKVNVIYNGVDTAFFAPAEQSAITRVKNKYKITAKNILLFVGRLVSEKAPDRILQVLPQILAQEPDTQLVIVGSSFFGKGNVTSYVKKLQALAEPVKDKVVFTGFIPVGDLPVLYSLASGFVSPGVWDDPSPKTMYEAAACATPIVSTKAGGIPEILGDTAILLEKNSNEKELTAAILKLLRDPLRKMLGERALRRVTDRFDLKIIVKQWSDFYEKI
jgi:spore coat protein SA